MRILVINPNTSPEITDRVAEVMRPLLPAEATMICATGRFGARYITNRVGAAIAAHAALDAFAEHASGCDAVFLACFGDPGLFALKELSPVPVVGMAEASCHQALKHGNRFSIVTGGERWKPMLEEFAAGLGLANRLASIRTINPSGGDVARDPAGALPLLAEECRRAIHDGAEAVILGGAGLAGLAPLVQNEVARPVLCSVEAGVRTVLETARLGKPPGSERTPPTDAVSLSPYLQSMLNRPPN